ncbi:hypothetical protein FAES_1475 [Fibrella aestuarina BUZ 2]|uniref:Uncharacterized protein n=1 Tax=Fibrella aestuarina BUZ 2 TaxID=1166018 RepID=I0K5T2_9BACT|nr:hypothetical protein [Fibrella aestuarina]CCG99485.1 hypothetical protein FAES_1475 [Fibrella aestuarina BUZ 2]
MKRLLSLSLLALLLYHTLATVWVAVGVWWQDQHDLTKQLTVYSSVDSMVEFQVVLGAGQAQQLVEQTTKDGFAYHGKFYDVISVDLSGDTLRIAGMENKTAGFWQQDLLSFVKKTISTASGDDTHRKAGHWLKLLLKEYQLADRLILSPSLLSWLVDVRIADTSLPILARYLAVLAPPPRG